MDDAELIRMMRLEIQRAIQIISSGAAGDNSSTTEDIDGLFAGFPTIPGRPIARPYGLVSRAPKGTISVTAQQGHHPGNKLTLGHRDKDAPSLQTGETQLYNQFGQAVYLKNGSVHLGKAAAANPSVLGTQLKAMLQDLITLLSTHTHVTGAPGSPTGPPIESAQIVEIQTDNVDNDLILSQLVFLEKEA